jgi:hypothetical protein
MNRRLFSAMVAVALALPSVVLQLALLIRSHPSALAAWPQLGITNVVLVVAMAALASDYSVAGREGRAALIGLGAALLLPGPTAFDSVAMRWGAGADAGTWLVILLPYMLLLAMLACAEAGLYLLATRPTTTLD